MDLPRIHRLRRQLLGLEGSRCARCDKFHFPPRGACPDCDGAAVESVALSGSGVLESFSQVFSPPTGLGPRPYHVGLVRCAEGVLIFTQLTDVDGTELAIGMEMEMVTRRLNRSEQGLIVYGYKFRPVKRPTT